MPAFGVARLISIPQLIEDGIAVLFKRGRAVGIIDYGDGNVIFTVTKNLRNNLFILDKSQNIGNIAALLVAITIDDSNFTRLLAEFTDRVDLEEDI